MDYHIALHGQSTLKTKRCLILVFKLIFFRFYIHVLRPHPSPFGSNFRQVSTLQKYEPRALANWPIKSLAAQQSRHLAFTLVILGLYMIRPKMSFYRLCRVTPHNVLHVKTWRVANPFENRISAFSVIPSQNIASYWGFRFLLIFSDG